MPRSSLRRRARIGDCRLNVSGAASEIKGVSCRTPPQKSLSAAITSEGGLIERPGLDLLEELGWEHVNLMQEGPRSAHLGYHYQGSMDLRAESVMERRHLLRQRERSTVTTFHVA